LTRRAASLKAVLRRFDAQLAGALQIQLKRKWPLRSSSAAILPASARSHRRDLNACEEAMPNPSETWVDALPGLDLSHDLSFALRDLGALTRFNEALARAGAHVESLALSRSNGVLNARCRLKGISPQHARDLVRTLARDGDIVSAASVEHVLLGRSERAP
jgi:hypothetical protein